jgi:hypothetical protein
LQTYKQATHSAALPIAYVPGALPKGALRIGVQELEGGQNSRQDTGPNGEEHREEEHGEVDVNLGQTRKINRRIATKDI